MVRHAAGIRGRLLFRDSICLDEAGNAWRILDARLRNAPTRWNQWMPWRRIPVEVTLSSLPKMSMGEVVTHLVKVLETENEFCESLSNQAPLEELKRGLSGCTSLPGGLSTGWPAHARE